MQEADHCPPLLFSQIGRAGDCRQIASEKQYLYPLNERRLIKRDSPSRESDLFGKALSSCFLPKPSSILTGWFGSYLSVLLVTLDTTVLQNVVLLYQIPAVENDGHFPFASKRSKILFLPTNSCVTRWAPPPPRLHCKTRTDARRSALPLRSATAPPARPRCARRSEGPLPPFLALSLFFPRRTCWFAHSKQPPPIRPPSRPPPAQAPSRSARASAARS